MLSSEHTANEDIGQCRALKSTSRHSKAYDGPTMSGFMVGQILNSPFFPLTQRL